MTNVVPYYNGGKFPIPSSKLLNSPVGADFMFTSALNGVRINSTAAK